VRQQGKGIDDHLGGVTRTGCNGIFQSRSLPIEWQFYCSPVPLLFLYVASLRCATGLRRKETSDVSLTHRSGFAYARLHCGLPSGRAYGAWRIVKGDLSAATTNDSGAKILVN
jgi:hypothetical protein